MSPTGRKIHEAIIRKTEVPSPLRIGILETPTGFEVNALHGWPQRMEAFFRKGLSNYHPDIARIRAWRKDGPYSTDNPDIVDAILSADYLYCGAGSPGYTVKHLQGSRAIANIVSACHSGTTLCLGSASAMAVGSYVLPVYEIFKAGEDLHWIKGLELLDGFGIRCAVVPHWNNQEGEDFDTTRCFMGVERFAALEALLPPDLCVIGIDEQTALVVDPSKGVCEVMGVGSVHVRKNRKNKEYPEGSSFGLSALSII